MGAGTKKESPIYKNDYKPSEVILKKKKHQRAQNFLVTSAGND